MQQLYKALFLFALVAVVVVPETEAQFFGGLGGLGLGFGMPFGLGFGGLGLGFPFGLGFGGLGFPFIGKKKK